MNSFHYLFKYIVIGDTCINCLIQPLGSPPLSCSFSTTSSKITMTLLLELNLALRSLRSARKPSSCKSGTPLARKISGPSPAPTTAVPSEPYSSTILPGTSIDIKEIDLHPRQELAQGGQDQRQLFYWDSTGRQQDRSGREASGFRGGGEEDGWGESHSLCLGQRQIVPQGGGCLQDNVGGSFSQGLEGSYSARSGRCDVTQSVGVRVGDIQPKTQLQSKIKNNNKKKKGCCWF